MWRAAQYALFIWGLIQVTRGIIGIRRCNRELRAIETLQRRIREDDDVNR
jgi:hypothetical protein